MACRALAGRAAGRAPVAPVLSGPPARRCLPGIASRGRACVLSDCDAAAAGRQCRTPPAVQ
eukprot:6751513-Heterocapsa_arctica.AAC.1